MAGSNRVVACNGSSCVLRLCTSTSSPKEPEYVVYAEGDTCPNFTISTYNNEEETYTLHDSAGKVIVLNFWYTTCGPCVAEIPHFNALQEKYPDDVDVLIIHRVDPPRAK